VYVQKAPGFQELRNMYDTQYYRPDDRVVAHETHWSVCVEGDKVLFQSVLRKVKRFQPAGNFLDIGSGYGLLLTLARDAGYGARGVELSKIPCEYSQKELGFEVFNGVLEAAKFPSAEFSVVTVLNVLEHVPDPMQTLQEIYRILKPGGVACFVVPNLIFGWPFIYLKKLFLEKRNVGMGIALFDVPWHLFLFSPRTIRAFLAKAGFQTLEVSNAPVIRNRNRIKTLAKFCVKGGADLLYALSGRGLVVGYSLLAVCQRPAESPSHCGDAAAIGAGLGFGSRPAGQ
jgi:SAM-dependent methyltransferase